MLSRLSLKTGMREYSSSRKSVRSIADRRVDTDGDDVGSRRHHLAHERLVEVHDRSDQLTLFPLDERRVGCLTLRRLGFRLGDRRRRAFFRPLPLPIVGAGQPARPPRHHERERDGLQKPCDDVEGGQEEFEHLLRIAAHDQRRQQVLADDAEDGHREDERRDRLPAAATDQDGEQDRGHREQDAEQQPDRHEELDGVVEVACEPVARPAPVRHEPEREAHEERESGLDRADVDRGQRQHHEQRGNHFLYVSRQSRARRWPAVSGYALAETRREAALPPQPALQLSHLACVGLVIVSQKVQQSMQGQDLQLDGETVAVPPGLPPGDATRYHYVSEVVIATPALGSGERQDVGRIVLPAVLPVQAPASAHRRRSLR